MGVIWLLVSFNAITHVIWKAEASLGIFMSLDCYARLDRMIAKQHRGLEPVTKKEL